ncbi:hypothetical protein M422DRAFT_257673 [Sphaerobolus stellatus SS14]|uniref:Uncharacterized protein n=1 Tax=Sphaerobolus stellatus (strain SS14) TaxID=990650 RepID=A0A0C9U957_SPHS4|nr:hypothetical protein M422DRAFT_257673 [Sphaerobolus stellatus SS14]
MGTERLVVDLGSPLCHSMSSLPPSSRRAESPFPPSHSKARHTPSSKPAAPRTTPAMSPPASRIHGRPSDMLLVELPTPPGAAHGPRILFDLWKHIRATQHVDRYLFIIQRQPVPSNSSLKSTPSTAIMITLDTPTIKSVVLPVSKPTSMARRTRIRPPKERIPLPIALDLLFELPLPRLVAQL